MLDLKFDSSIIDWMFFFRAEAISFRAEVFSFCAEAISACGSVFFFGGNVFQIGIAVILGFILYF